MWRNYSRADLNIRSLRAQTLEIAAGGTFRNLAGRGKTIYVDTNNGNDSKDGLSWDKAKVTMDGAFDIAASGDTIYFVGNVREYLTTPTGVAHVTVIGVGNRPQHADTHPLNLEDGAATWKEPTSTADTPLITVACPGWRFENILFAANSSNCAILLTRSADEDATEIDASHATIIGCRFASGEGGISDTGGCFDVGVYECWFQALTGYCILGVGNIGVGQLMWHIRNNHFNNFTNGVKIAAHECVIEGNFFTDGGTPNTTFVLNTNNGGGRDNFIVRNWFQTATANFNTPDVVGCATDVWGQNGSIDSTAAGVGGSFEWGQPA